MLSSAVSKAFTLRGYVPTASRLPRGAHLLRCRRKLKALEQLHAAAVIVVLAQSAALGGAQVGQRGRRSRCTPCPRASWITCMPLALQGGLAGALAVGSEGRGGAFLGSPAVAEAPK